MLFAGGRCMPVHLLQAGAQAFHAHRLFRRAASECLHAGQCIPAALQAAAPATAGGIHKVRSGLQALLEAALSILALVVHRCHGRKGASF